MFLIKQSLWERQRFVRVFNGLSAHFSSGLNKSTPRSVRCLGRLTTADPRSLLQPFHLPAPTAARQLRSPPSPRLRFHPLVFNYRTATPCLKRFRGPWRTRFPLCYRHSVSTWEIIRLCLLGRLHRQLQCRHRRLCPPPFTASLPHSQVRLLFHLLFLRTAP